jgi:UDP-N-acetylglucosamine--N-acetylmuramyl-(pentapeptide) pyrophosphoryl-undecaprenol N-acetylglucosamine transferase
LRKGLPVKIADFAVAKLSGKACNTANNIEIDWLTVNGVRGKGFLALFKMPLMLIKSCLEARKILQIRKPDVVLGMGGFVAGPGGLMAKLMGIPLVIH